MRLYKVILLVNLAVGIGFVLGSLWWAQEVSKIERQVAGRGSNVSAGHPLAGLWAAQGVVRLVAPELNRVFIEHEDIPGLMEAMTMAFEPSNPHLLDGLAPGDQVQFTLQKNGERLSLVAIAKGDAP